MKRKKRKEGKYTEWQNNQDVMLESYFYDINVTNDKIAKSVVSSSNIAIFFFEKHIPQFTRYNLFCFAYTLSIFRPLSTNSAKMETLS